MKKHCNCYGMQCHASPHEPLALIHLTPKVGGKGVKTFVTAECVLRFKQNGTKFTVLEDFPT